jgi:hypothetical protein
MRAAGGLLTLLLALPLQAQEIPAAITPVAAERWQLGLLYKQDGLGYAGAKALTGEGWVGVQMLHRLEAYFGTGAALLFSQRDSALEFNLDARWYWPLGVVEPYLGAQLNYLTRDNGGVALALRPGVQLSLMPRLQLEAAALLRYDLFGSVFQNNSTPLLSGFSLGVLYQI